MTYLSKKGVKARKRVLRFCSSKAFYKARNRRARTRWLKRMKKFCCIKNGTVTNTKLDYPNETKKEVVYQECLYKDMTGEDISPQELRKKCGFNCSEETCEYCIEATIETDERKRYDR